MISIICRTVITGYKCMVRECTENGRVKDSGPQKEVNRKREKNLIREIDKKCLQMKMTSKLHAVMFSFA